jgi:circadian clock protein KaiB
MKGHFKFRLYIAGDTENSVQARTNLAAICREHIPNHEIEIVDVLKEPKTALVAGIFMTPTLIKLMPGSIKKIVGTLSQTETVLLALGLDEGAAAA